MTSPDGGGLMPRVVTHFGCTSNDGVFTSKFPADASWSFQQGPSGVPRGKKSELVTPRCPLSYLFPGGGSFTSSQFLGFVVLNREDMSG
jgi:hypothetical protein